MPDPIPNSIIRQPKEWADWFRSRVPIPTGHWKTLRDNEHRWAIAIAGITDLQFLSDVNEQIARNLSDPRGSSYDSFLKNFDRLTEEGGWSGATPWRRELIWHMNTRNAYADGRWFQLTDPAVLAGTGAWRWDHRWPRNPRRDHLEINGKLFPPGSQFFDGIKYPPNGYFMCHCVITMVPKSEADMAAERSTPRYLPGRSPEDRNSVINGILDRLGDTARMTFQVYMSRWFDELLNEILE
jgi:hypothetical protein